MTLKDIVEIGLNQFCQRHFSADITNLSLLTGGANMELWAFDCAEHHLFLQTIKYGQGRKPFGKPLWQNQSIEFPFVELATQIKMLRLLIRPCKSMAVLVTL